MVKVMSAGKEIYMDGYLRKNLDLAINQVNKKDWDMVFAVDGTEGGGKSTLAQQCAGYVDQSFCVERVAFTAEEFKSTVINASKGQAVIWDEAMCGANSRATISSVNKGIVDLLAEIRQKNLFIFVVLPSFFDLDKYIALWRARALIHVYHDNFTRGFFQFYNESGKKYLYVKGKKFYNYKCQKPNFWGRFTSGYVIDETEYRRKKLESLRATKDDKVAPLHKRWFKQRNASWYVMKEKLGWSANDIKKEVEKYGIVMPSTQKINLGIQGLNLHQEQHIIENLIPEPGRKLHGR